VQDWLHYEPGPVLCVEGSSRTGTSRSRPEKFFPGPAGQAAIPVVRPWGEKGAWAVVVVDCVGGVAWGSQGLSLCPGLSSLAPTGYNLSPHL
jgi:hypothetical protein